MKKGITINLKLMMFIYLVCFTTAPAFAQEGYYGLTWKSLLKHKAIYDDPRSIYEELPLEKVLPTETYNQHTYDVETMKRLGTEIVAFKSPDYVGKIAPEVKPG